MRQQSRLLQNSKPTFEFSRSKIETNLRTNVRKNLKNLKRQFLHAKIIGFMHPKKKREMIFDSILPQELEIILKMLRILLE